MSKPRASKMRTRFLFVVVFTLILAALWVWLLPYVARTQLVAWMERQGAAQAEVADLRVSLWHANLTLEGLTASAADRETLVLGSLTLSWDWQALLQGKLVLNAASLERALLPISAEPALTAIYLGPLTLPLAGAEREEESRAAADVWPWGLRQLTLQEVSLPLRWQQQTHRLQIDQLTVDDLYSWQPLRQSAATFQGALDGSPIRFGSQGRPLSHQPDLALNLQVNSLPLAPLLQPWLPAFSAVLSADLKLQLHQEEGGWKLSQQGWLELAQLSYAQDDLSLADQVLRWDGDLAVALAPQKAVDAQWQGLLTSTGLVFDLGPLQTRAGTLNWQSQGRWSADQVLALDSSLQLSAVDLALDEQLSVAGSALQWQGKTQLSVETEQIRWSLAGDANLSGLNLDPAGQPKVSVASLDWAGEVQGQGAEWQTDGRLALTRLLAAAEAGEALLQLADLNAQIQGLAGQEPLKVAVGETRLRGLVVGPAEQPLLNLQQAKLNQAEWTLNRLEVGVVDLEGLQGQIDLDESGRPARWLALAERLKAPERPAEPAAQPAPGEAPQATDEPAKETTAAAAGAFSWALQALQLSGDNRIQLHDRSVRPELRFAVSALNATLGAMDSRNPSEVPWTLQADLNGSGRMELAGRWAFLQAEPQGQWRGWVKQLQLPLFSSYSIRANGYQVDRGRLNWQGEGLVDQGRLDSRNELLIERLEISQADPRLVAETAASLNMPLETALGILTDDDNNLELELPVNGALNDPEFGLQSVTKVVMTKVMSEAAIGYLSHALQPYGALITLSRVAMKAGKALSVRLQPLLFVPGQVNPAPGEAAYLDKLSLLLEERQGLNLNVCGRAVAADYAALLQAAQAAADESAADQPSMPAAGSNQAVVADAPLSEVADVPFEQLHGLAEQRARWVREGLLSRGVGAERLFECFPQVDTEDDAQPAVVLGF